MLGFEPIPEFPEYAVDKSGRVIRRLSGRPRAKPGKLIRPRRAGRGRRYLYVSLSLGKRGVVQRTVHSLVAQTFISKRPVGATIDHKDGNPANNHVLNLEYVTNTENCRRYVRRTGGKRAIRDTSFGRVSLKELSFKTGISVKTLNTRWFRGDRDDRLIRPVLRRTK